MPLVPDTRIKRVASFHELATTPFADGINALCWERSLPGDFAALVRLLSVVGPGGDRAPEENAGMITIDPATLESLLADAGSSTRAALQILLEDLQRLRSIDRDPVLNLIHGYPRDEDGGPVPTDVFSFHADSAPIAADTWLCTYHGPPSEGLHNEDAVRKIDVPEIRAELLKLYGGPDDESFAEFLHENHYDLHYAPKLRCRASDLPVPGPEAAEGLTPLRTSSKPSTFNLQLSTAAPSAAYSFGLFNLWRIACDYPDAPVPPCVHRAPATLPGDSPRLLLIS